MAEMADCRAHAGVIARGDAANAMMIRLSRMRQINMKLAANPKTAIRKL
jgi:hypothetical protein